MRALVEAGTPVVSIFGKTWDLHVKRALGITPEENLKLISETVKHLKDHGKEVVYDAEHFFDGYAANPDYALETLDGRAPGRRGRAVPVRHQRRHAHRAAGGDRRRSAPAIRWRHRHPHAQRFGHGGGQHHRRGGGGRHARAGLHERLRRALRQRQPGLRHRQPGDQAGTHHRGAGEAGQPVFGVPVHRGAGQPAAAQRSAVRRARARLPTRAACT